MIVRSLDEVGGTGRDVSGEGWRSRRLLVRDDAMGFSLSDTTVVAGAELHLQYRHHLEACYCLYGNELSLERGPIEAGLGWCCREHTGFIGATAVAAAREAGPAEMLVAFALQEAGIARAGNPVLGGGEVTSGTLSPSLRRGIGMAYVPAARAAVGTRLEIDVRGKMRAAVVEQKPLYRKAS